MALNLAENIQAARARRESDFFNNLLAYGMQSGGEFEIVDDTPTFVPGGDMPDKSAMWNEFLRAKGGRLTQADIQQFEMAWKQANQMKTTNQLSQLTKLRNRGYSPDEIKGAIEDSPELYNNLLDLVGDLEAAGMGGDENAFAQAQTIKQMMPERDTGGLIGGMIEDPGLFSRLAPFGLLGAGAYAANRFMPTKDFIQSQMNIRNEMRSNRNAKRVLNPQIKRAEKLIKKNPNAKTINAAKARLADLKEQAKSLDNKYESLKQSKKDVTRMTGARSIPSRYARLSTPAKVGATGAVSYGLSQLGALGEYLGGKTGKSIGEDVGSLGLLGWGAMGLRGLRAAPHPYLKAIGYAPLAIAGASELINKYTR